MIKTPRTLQEVERFISIDLPTLIKGDLKNHQLVKEADVECASYMYLREYFGPESKWKVLARRYIPSLKKYIDLLIFHGEKPRIAIEIKWGTEIIQQKDRDSLNGALIHLGVNKVYWMSVSGIGAPKQRITKSLVEKNALKQIIIRGEFTPEEEALWKQTIPKFRHKVGVGSGKKLQTTSR